MLFGFIVVFDTHNNIFEGAQSIGENPTLAIAESNPGKNQWNSEKDI